MRLILLLLFLLQISFCFSQNEVAIVTTKNNQTAYYHLEKGITYIESKDPNYTEAICKFKNGFARMRRTTKFYYIDEYGKPIFSTVFDKAEDFNEGFAEIKLNGKWGFINKKGIITIEPQFYETHPFSNGLSQIAYSITGKHGYIDTTGNIIIKPQFDDATAFINDRAWVLMGGKWGLINKEGKYILNPTYKEVKYVFKIYNQWGPEFYYRYVTKLINNSLYTNDNLRWVLLDGKWGLINKDGKTLIPCVFSEVKDISESYTWVKQKEYWGLVDSLGNYLIEPNERNPLIYASNATFKLFSEFHDGLMKYQSKGMIGYLDTHLKVVIPAKYDKASDFKNGLACVYQDGYCGIIDLKGNIIIPINYKEIIICDNDLFPAKDDNGIWGYLNLKNEWVIKPQFKNVTPFVVANYK